MTIGAGGSPAPRTVADVQAMAVPGTVVVLRENHLSNTTYSMQVFFKSAEYCSNIW